MANIEIIGKGEIGDKAKQLLEKTPVLEEIGFQTPRRVILAEDYFDGFFQINKLGRNLRDVSITSDLEKRLFSGKFSSKQSKLLLNAIRSFDNVPLAVRSSAAGDSRGTGTYQTKFCEGNTSDVKNALKEVLWSYFTEDAIDFRRDAKTGEGFGIILEPIIGFEMGDNVAPLLSGFGYTSTPRDETHIMVVPGLGGGVDGKCAEKIYCEEIKSQNWNLREYIKAKNKEFAYSDSPITCTSALLGFNSNGRYRSGLPLKVYELKEKTGNGGLLHTELSLEKMFQYLKDVSLEPIFSMMKKMEDSFGKPQYFEWVATPSANGLTYWITQIANVNKKLDILDFEHIDNILFNAHTVTGTGMNECNKIVTCWNPDDGNYLHEFNKKNKNYVLMYSSRLTTTGTPRKLTYSDFSNASVFLEYQDARHAGDPVSHLGGQLDLTGKLFGVIDFSERKRPDFEKISKKEINEDGLVVYQGKVKALASEKQNRLIVGALD